MSDSIEPSFVTHGNWKLFYKGTDKMVVVGSVMNDRFGEHHTITGGRPPHKPASSGFVWTQTTDGQGHEYYPNVFDMEWREAI